MGVPGQPIPNLCRPPLRDRYSLFVPPRVNEFDWRDMGSNICGLLFSPGRRGKRKVYNIVDDDPAPREEVFAYAQNFIEKKWPGQITRISEQEESLATVKKKGFAAEKRVSNARMKKELGVRLLHPSYRTGLESIIDQMHNPFHHSLLDSRTKKQ